MRSLLARLHDTFKRQALDRELDDEIATHLELATAEMQARGMNREEARRAALKGFGGLFQVKEAEREVRSFPGLETIWVVSRDAVRLLWKQPRFAADAIFTLALGIGATTAVTDLPTASHSLWRRVIFGAARNCRHGRAAGHGEDERDQSPHSTRTSTSRAWAGADR